MPGIRINIPGDPAVGTAGRKSNKGKLSGKEQTIRELLEQKVPKTQIAKIFHVDRMTVDAFIRNRMKGS